MGLVDDRHLRPRRRTTVGGVNHCQFLLSLRQIRNHITFVDVVGNQSRDIILLEGIMSEIELFSSTDSISYFFC
jgi:hypothetical protein